MPLIHLATSTGLASFRYTLSTPANSNADAIAEGTPTLVLIHPITIASEIFHPIYANPQLRRFNLLSLDLRGHGSTSASADDTYSRETAAKDVLNLMDALNIGASHLMGVSMGSCIALQIAIFAPERVLSLFMFSPLPLIEPPEVIGGRQEIWDCWMEAFSDPKNSDTLALTDALTGGLQYAWNNLMTNLTRAYSCGQGSSGLHRNWAPEHYDLFHAVTVKFFSNRPPHPVESLARVQCPVALVHCSEDIAYPIHYAEELLALMQSAGLNPQFLTIDGAPHYGVVTHFEETKELLYRFLLASESAALPSVPTNVESPFLADLLRLGLQEGDVEGDVESDSDKEDSFAVKLLSLHADMGSVRAPDS